MFKVKFSNVWRGILVIRWLCSNRYFDMVWHFWDVWERTESRGDAPVLMSRDQAKLKRSVKEDHAPGGWETFSEAIRRFIKLQRPLVGR